MMIAAKAVMAKPLQDPLLFTVRPSTVALDEINKTLKMASIGLIFEFDKESGEMIAKMADVESGNIIRQIPSEDVVRIAKAMGKLQGIVINQAILNKWRASRGKLRGSSSLSLLVNTSGSPTSSPIMLLFATH